MNQLVFTIAVGALLLIGFTLNVVDGSKPMGSVASAPNAGEFVERAPSGTGDSDIPTFLLVTEDDLGYISSRAGVRVSSQQEASEYRVFLEKIEQVCPYYEPNGYQYRDCLRDLLIGRDDEMEGLYDEIVRELDDVDHPYANDLFEPFERLQEVWIPYRDALCEARNVGSLLGSNYEGFLAICKLYENHKYSGEVREYQHVLRREKENRGSR